MRLTTALTLLFATVALAAPAAEANPEAGASKAELEARGSCNAGCSCLNGKCNCASCTIMGCNWYYDGKTC